MPLALYLVPVLWCILLDIKVSVILQPPILPLTYPKYPYIRGVSHLQSTFYAIKSLYKALFQK